MDTNLVLFEKLYNKYYNMTYKYILSQIKDSWTAEDIASEVFVKIYKHRDEINDIDKSSSWIIKIARNSIIDYYRKKKLVDSDEKLDYEAFYDTGFDNVFIKDEYTFIMKQLPNEIKSLLTMRYCHNLKFREIADIMNLTENSAKYRVYHALKIAQEAYANAVSV